MHITRQRKIGVSKRPSVAGEDSMCDCGVKRLRGLGVNFEEQNISPWLPVTVPAGVIHALLTTEYSRFVPYDSIPDPPQKTAFGPCGECAVRSLERFGWFTLTATA